MNISDEFIRKNLKPYAFVPSTRQTKQIRAYVTLLAGWNKKISLTTIVEPGEVLRTHFGESIFAATSGLIDAGRLADVGTGAGFPGVPLAIAVPELDVTLVEPNLKKTVFLSEVKRELRLENVKIERGTMDDVEATDFDYVTARALGRFDEFLEFARAHTRDKGKATLWLSEEDAKGIAALVEGWLWLEPRSIPLSDRRCILFGEKKQSTGT